MLISLLNYSSMYELESLLERAIEEKIRIDWSTTDEAITEDARITRSKINPLVKIITKKRDLIFGR